MFIKLLKRMKGGSFSIEIAGLQWGSKTREIIIRMHTHCTIINTIQIFNNTCIQNLK